MFGFMVGMPPNRGRIADLAMLPLRVFLGGTFVYAGLQKLADSQFFSPTAPGFIGHQLSGFVRSGSPLGPLLTAIAIPHASAFGALIAFCELWVGLSALAGLLTRLGALGGMALSLTLYLAATWSVRPFFLGADLPYAVLWLTLALIGAGTYSLDEHFFGTIPRTSSAPPAPSAPRAGAATRPTSTPLAQNPVARARFLRGIGTAAAIVGAGSVLGAIVRLRTPNRSFASAGQALDSAGHTAATGQGSATLLGNVHQLPLNSAGQYTDPGTGDPAVLVHLPDGRFVAFDAVCTHAGCTVEYDPAQRQLVCPCHGASFDPTRAGSVVNGPAVDSLTPLHVSIDARGNAYAGAGNSGSTAETR